MTLNIANTTKTCNICDSSELVEIFTTSDMPLTGLYLEKPTKANELCNDQTLLQCMECGHAQLKYIIAPDDLYDTSYTHRSTESNISSTGNIFFHDYLRKIIHGKDKFKNILEIGCNDLVLINKIQDIGEKIVGIDPIWKNKDFSLNDKTKILGCFVDEVDKYEEDIGKPDLIVSAHTFEHVDRTFERFSKLTEIASDECLFLIEMPSYETLIKTGRFDQVFHQHLQYINLQSMLTLVKRLGCEYVSHSYNFSYWGGTFLFAFKKTCSKSLLDQPKINKILYSDVKLQFSEFQQNLNNQIELLKKFDEPIYGFGAAQMLPIIAHHAKTDLSFMQGIIDDNETRLGTFLPNIKCPTIAPRNAKDLKDSLCLITAIDSARPILARLLDLQPRRIAHLFPFI